MTAADAGSAMSRARAPSRGRVGRASAPYLLVLPSILFAFWIIGYPIFDMAQMSLQTVNRFGATSGFNDFGNYNRLFSHQLFLGCLYRTLVWTVFVVGGTVLLSIPIALALNERFYGRHLARIIIMLPWAVSLTMSGIVWRWSLNGQFGMVNATLNQFGLLTEPVEWLAHGEHRLSDRDRDRHPGLDPVHGDRVPRRPVLAAGRHLRGGQDRRRHSRAALPLPDAAADAAASSTSCWS